MTRDDGIRAERAARNELLFRAVNEQILKMSERFRAELSDLDIVCECADSGCTSAIRINVHEFERANETKNVFLVLSGHEDLRVEDVVERQTHYVVVRKRGPAARLVETAG
jgi:hypothetical protein